MKKELLKGLSDEQIAKIKECKNHEELLTLAKQEGIELTDEQLQTISGGGACSFISKGIDKIDPFDCPHCGYNGRFDKDGNIITCPKCGKSWRDNG